MKDKDRIMSDHVNTDPEALEPSWNGPEATDRRPPLRLPEPGDEAFSRTEIRAGIFVLVAVVILGFFYFFGKDVLSLFQPHKNLVVYFNDISGLEEGAAVRYAGMTVGKVTDIRIVEGKDHKIEVDLDVLAAVPLREGAVASIRATELVIGKYVDLTGGDPESPLLRDDAVLAGSQEPTLDEVINSAGRIILNLRDIVEQVSQIFREQSVETLMTNLNRMAELAAGEDQGILVNLKKALQTLTEAGVVDEFVTITRAVSDNKDRIVDLMEQANRLAIDTNRMMLGHERQISSLLNDLSRLAGAFGADAEPLARNLSALTSSASSVSGDLPGLVRNTQSLLGKMDITLNALNKILARTENIDENDVREFFQHEGMRIYFTERQAPKRVPGPERVEPER
jgi:phospholipid/cholesterol/gamma-HCH transport system substrate-binding protein